MSSLSRLFSRVIYGLAIPLVAAIAVPVAQAASDTVLLQFEESQQGSTPLAGVVADKTGALYGTTSQGGTNFENSLGTVYKLTPSANGKTYKETILYTFTGGRSGGIPKAGLLIDKEGALYGTTYQGGVANCDSFLGCGTVFKLTPPPKGKTKWTETTLHVFNGTMQGVGPDGIHPWAGLTMDKEGALYGTTFAGGTTGCLGQGCGVVFKLTPPARGKTVWTETVLHKFTNAQFGFSKAGVILDADGAVYGETAGDSLQCCGLVYKLTPPAKGKTVWAFHVLHAFTGADGAAPNGGMVFDSKGSLYGTTIGDGSDNYGTVFKLNPAKGDGPWGGDVLLTITLGGLAYAGPNGAPVLDAKGAVYIATGAPPGGKAISPTADASETLAGAVVKLVPPSATSKIWKPEIIHSFQTTNDGAYPSGKLLLLNGALYGTTREGWNADGSAQTNGTVYKIASP